jgi:hypothetical protein
MTVSERNICLFHLSQCQQVWKVCSPGYMSVFEITGMWETLPWLHHLNKRGFYKQTVGEWKPRCSVGLLVAFIEIYYFVKSLGIYVSQMNTDMFHLVRQTLRCSGRVSRSCSTCGTRCVTLVTNPVISNAERTMQVEHICIHLWHIYS